MRSLLLGASPAELVAAAPLPAWLVVDQRRAPALAPGEAVAVDCGGRVRGRLDPSGRARRALRAYDRRQLATIAVAAGLDPALAPCRLPDEPGWSLLEARHEAVPAQRGAVLLASIRLPPAGWSLHLEAADRARFHREALGDAAAEDLRAGRPTALVVTPLEDAEPERAAERAARALAIAALRAVGKSRARLLLHGDAVLRAVAAAGRVGAYRLEAREQGLIVASLGKRQVLIAPGEPPPVETG